MNVMIPKSSESSGADWFFFCPACKCAHGIWTTKKNGQEAIWTFNGDVVKPSIHPSLKLTWHEATPPVTAENLEQWRKAPWPQTKVEHCCHCVVNDGLINFAKDSTHALSGQTVALEPFPGSNA